MVDFGRSLASGFTRSFDPTKAVQNARTTEGGFFESEENKAKRERLAEAADIKIQENELKLNQAKQDASFKLIEAGDKITTQLSKAKNDEQLTNIVTSMVDLFPTNTPDENMNQQNQFLIDRMEEFQVADAESRGNVDKATTLTTKIKAGKVEPREGLAELITLQETTPNQALSNQIAFQIDAVKDSIGLGQKVQEAKALTTAREKAKLAVKGEQPTLGEQIATGITTGRRQEALEKELGTQDAKIITDARERGIQASTQLGEIQAQRELLNAEGFDTGALEDVRNVVGNVLIDLGAPESLITNLVTNVAAGDAFKAISNGRVLDKATLLKGNTSDRDIKFVVNAMENLGNTEAGNRLLLDYLESGAQRAVDKAVFLEEGIASGKPLSKVNSEWAKFVSKTPTIKKVKNPHTGEDVFVSVETFKRKFPDMDMEEVLSNWRKL